MNKTVLHIPHYKGLVDLDTPESGSILSAKDPLSGNPLSAEQYLQLFSDFRLWADRLGKKIHGVTLRLPSCRVSYVSAHLYSLHRKE